MPEIRKRKSSLTSKKDTDSDISEDSDREFQEIIKDIENDQWKERSVDEPRLTKTRSAIYEWGISCSWHGIPHMAQSLSRAAIIFWTILLLISAVMFVYLITITVKQYFSFQKLVNLNIGMDESNFPSITFCNSNPYKLSAVQTIPELKALLSIYSQAL